MATTRLMPLHTGKGRTASAAIANVIDYVKNPQKTDGGKLIYGYMCDPFIADTEFVIAKQQYINITGRQRGSDDVIAYHLRQAFLPGETTPEEANRIGQELAMKLTKGSHAFVVCTHIDKHHVHNHIIFNSVNLDCTRKFRNFWNSTWAVRRMNDTICLEHCLSIVEDPKPSRGSYGTWIGDEKALSFHEQLRRAIDAALEEKPKDFSDFLKQLEAYGVEVNADRKNLRLRVKGQTRYTRCNSLNGDYTEQAIRERIEGIRIVAPRAQMKKSIAPRVGLLIDIDAAIREGKGQGYEHWAKVFNVKQLSRAVLYLKEHDDMSYEELSKRTDESVMRFNELSGIIKDLELQMSDNSELQRQIVNYVKTREIYAEYRKSGYSKKYRENYESEILIHQAAKKHFDQLGLKKLPRVRELREQYDELLAQKRKVYAEYKQAREDMKELYNVKENIRQLLHIDERRDKQPRTIER